MTNFLLKISLYSISYLPMWVLYIISDVLYLIVYKILGYRKKVVQNNLKNSFPEKTERELKIIKQKFYHHFFDNIVESVKAITASESFFRKRMNIPDTNLLNHYHKNNQSVVLCVGHYCNWEWGIISVSIFAEQKMMGVYKVLSNDFFDKLMKNTRSKFGADLISMENTFRHLIKTKEQCKIIGLLADQSPVKNESNYWTTFLNQETSVYLGPEKIAEKLNLPVVFCNIKKIKRGYYQLSIEEITANPKETNKGDITSLYLQKLENQINETPEYWLWTHRRWKHKK